MVQKQLLCISNDPYYEVKKKYRETNREFCNSASKECKRKKREELKQTKLLARPYNYGKVKRCSSCNTEKDLSKFSNQQKGKFGKRARCKDCDSMHWNSRDTEQRTKHVTRNRKYREENLDACRVRSLANLHKRRALCSGGENYIPRQWNNLLDITGRVCLCCGKPESEAKLTVDHIKPITRGGDNSINNIQPLCWPCNNRKQVREIDYRPGKEGAMFHQ